MSTRQHKPLHSSFIGLLPLHETPSVQCSGFACGAAIALAVVVPKLLGGGARGTHVARHRIVAALHERSVPGTGGGACAVVGERGGGHERCEDLSSQ